LRCGAARGWCWPFIGGLRRFGGGRYFRREAAGELARLLDVWPGFAVTGDETARAAVGQLVAGTARPGAERGWRLAVVVMVAGRRGRAQGGRRRGAGVVVGQEE
jgi:hypothetical protein